jgi:hypothetical protein
MFNPLHYTHTFTILKAILHTLWLKIQRIIKLRTTDSRTRTRISGLRLMDPTRYVSKSVGRLRSLKTRWGDMHCSCADVKSPYKQKVLN